MCWSSVGGAHGLCSDCYYYFFQWHTTGVCACAM
jgi:hypothetical protein